MHQPAKIAMRRLGGALAKGAAGDTVGIHAVSTYVPVRYVEQSALEGRDGVSAGKYTVGLGQTRMSFCTDSEDINSIAMNAVARLLESTGLSPKDVGRLDVGTETLVDKSKSVKTNLMHLFAPSGNTSIEGIDSVNACYGGVAALNNCVDWISSPNWDGRYAIVVAGDIAVYEPGPARPTGGAGAVAILLGPGAPLVVESGLRATHVENAYDFYKPDGASEYAVVDGKLSNECYIRALDKTFAGFSRRWRAKTGGADFRLGEFDHFVAHAPYNKLVRKSYARLAMLDHVGGGGMVGATDAINAALAECPVTDAQVANGDLPADSYTSRSIEKAFLEATAAAYESVVGPSTVGPANVGNTYTASVFLGLASLLEERAGENKGGLTSGQRVGVYSYGSGLVASMFSLRVDSADGVKDIAGKAGLRALLEDRVEATPEEFEQALLKREAFKGPGLIPTTGTEAIRPGDYYLAEVDHLYRRRYERA